MGVEVLMWLLWVEHGGSPVSIPGRHHCQEQRERGDFKTRSRTLVWRRP